MSLRTIYVKENIFSVALAEDKILTKQYVPNEYQASIAWFKLSELVARGERERAFSIFRLLIHALNDEAYVAQLKGDLWYAFHEHDRAREAYYSAIAGYDLSERLYQSAFVYERLSTIEENSLTIRIAMIIRFAELSCTTHVIRYINELITLAKQQNQLEICLSSLYETSCSPSAYTIIQTVMARHGKNHLETHLTLQ
jgi:tetratricopeptide (TPR) repeat protein